MSSRASDLQLEDNSMWLTLGLHPHHQVTLSSERNTCLLPEDSIFVSFNFPLYLIQFQLFWVHATIKGLMDLADSGWKVISPVSSSWAHNAITPLSSRLNKTVVCCWVLNKAMSGITFQT